MSGHDAPEYPEVGTEQMQFTYFIGTHLRHRFPGQTPDWKVFITALPASHSIGDKAWQIATEGAFWTEML